MKKERISVYSIRRTKRDTIYKKPETVRGPLFATVHGHDKSVSHVLASSYNPT